MNKITTMEEAVRTIPSGCSLGLGGMTLYRRPVALVRSLLGTEATGFTLMSITCGFESDLLVGAGRVKQVRTCYFGLEAFGLAPMFTAGATVGEVRVIEETEASLAFGFRASLSGVGFMPSRAWLGTDLPIVRPDVKTVQDPYSGEQYTAFPALELDVAVVHAVEADQLGNAELVGNLALDRQMALVADHVIVTAERVVERLSGALELPGYNVSHVVEAPGGAWPTSCYPLYAVDGDELLDYVEFCSSGRFDDYLDRFLAHAPSGGGVDQGAGTLYNRSR
jgi:glutaconate CoA-transferase subunit A